MGNIKITGTGRCLGEKVVSNDDIATIVETSDEWISSRTGIKERCISVDKNTSDLAAEAATKAIKNSGIDVLDLDLIIVATTTPDSFTPSTACLVQAKLGAKNAVAFDISAACSGFIYALNCASKFLDGIKFKKALVVGSEVLSRILDWEDRSTCVLFGDGAGAAVLEYTEENGIMDIYIGSDGSKGKCLSTGEFGIDNPFSVKERCSESKLDMAGKDVFKFAVNIIPYSVNKVLEDNSISLDEIKYIVPHQANYRIVESASKRLKLPMERFYINLDKYGNTSAASIPIALDEMNEKGMLNKGDKIVLVGFGGGLTWGAILLQW
ncbi:3-oxoacyl-[acyl-carrier-protein] synthase 3 [Clostridium bornimense]|uniref:Beta-ketoacyl-[acyl-carrier-protein] synthase III n=1 Tax=Clostridium bornimense TaxID=1216932 RepID=W6RYQ0_9CLOT|nr:beta-ketoacyl-ACP synthase III [Clostridium bornimense]CDM69776.1 3-oxoacyl-[acyl-carrier-protein] synthase 3 [Clostridium bornimense]